MFASDTERRILGHLPVWTATEGAFEKAELKAGAAASIRSYTVGGLTACLHGDGNIPTRTEEQVHAFLEGLQEKGYAADTDGQWSMTEDGLSALGEPALAEHEQTPGPVQIGTRNGG